MVMVGLAIALLIYALIRGGGTANDGVKLAGKTLWNALPLLLAGFPDWWIGASVAAARAYPSLVGKEAGVKKGVLIGCLAGLIWLALCDLPGCWRTA